MYLITKKVCRSWDPIVGKVSDRANKKHTSLFQVLWVVFLKWSFSSAFLSASIQYKIQHRYAWMYIVADRKAECSHGAAKDYGGNVLGSYSACCWVWMCECVCDSVTSVLFAVFLFVAVELWVLSVWVRLWLVPCLIWLYCLLQRIMDKRQALNDFPW